MKRVWRWSLLVFSLMSMLAGCGKSSNGTTPTATTISGTAAAGAPIIGTVTVKDSSSPAKTKTVTIAADGKYTVDVTDMTAPFMFRADGFVGGNGYHIFSAAAQADIGGTINVTPLTDLIVANIAKDLAQNYFNSGNFAGLTSTALTTQAAALQAKLLPTLQAIGLDSTIDLLRTSFSANHAGLDAALDVIQVTVNTSTNVATLTNLITNQSITNNITTNAISGSLDNTSGMSSGISAIQAINTNLQTLNNLFAAGLPSPSNTQLLALFDQTASAFLFGGMDLNTFLSFLTSNQQFVGLSFSNVTLKSLNQAQDAATISFVVTVNGNILDNVSSWNLIKKNGSWVSQGDQKIALIGLKAASIYNSNTSTIYNGISFDIEDRGGRGITSAVITGPGINGSITATSRLNQDYLQMPDSFDGQVQNMADADISNIPDTGATYTIMLYAGSNLLATYNEPLPYKPYLKSQLSPANFIQITAPTSAALQAFTTGNIQFSWILPAGITSSWVELNVSNNPDIGARVKPADTSYILTVSSNTTGIKRWIWVSGQDSFQREMTTYKE